MTLEQLEKNFNSFQTNISLSFVDFQNKTNEKISSIQDDLQEIRLNIEFENKKLRNNITILSGRITHLEKESAKTPPDSTKKVSFWDLFKKNNS